MVGTLVELLAAIPSVVIGLWGIFVLGPFVQHHLGPFLSRWLGFLPFFKGTPQLTGYLPAVIVLTIMILPITASVARELFLTVPRDLKEASSRSGRRAGRRFAASSCRTTRGGLVAAVMLGLGRAVGEAIAVTQVIGDTLGIHSRCSERGHARQPHRGAVSSGATNIHISSLVYWRWCCS